METSTLALPEIDVAHLAERGITYELHSEANMLCLVIRDFPIPAGYDRPIADLMIRFNIGYPDVPPDMWWFAPAVKLATGQEILATNGIETYLGKTWQRWSRHFQPGQWQPGIDSLESFLALLRRELNKWVGQ
jgi:hypothetical protein